MEHEILLLAVQEKAKLLIIKKQLLTDQEEIRIITERLDQLLEDTKKFQQQIYKALEITDKTINIIKQAIK